MAFNLLFLFGSVALVAMNLAGVPKGGPRRAAVLAVMWAACGALHAGIIIDKLAGH
jgi:hypothetical protein